MTDPKYQGWKILNLDRCCSHDRVRGYDPFLDFIFRDHRWLVLLLARPVFRTRAPNVCLPPPGTSRSDLGRLAFPPEIIDLVFGCIEEPKDVTALAVSHRLLSVAGWHRLIQIRRSRMTTHSWSGDRIITLGELVEEIDDLPRGVRPRKMRDVIELPEHDRWYSRRDIKEMSGSYGRRLQEDESEDGDSEDDSDASGHEEDENIIEFEGREDEGFFWFVDKHFPELQEASKERRGGNDYNRGRSTPRSKLDGRRTDMFYASTAPYYPASSEWALCNLTGREYILASKIAKIPRWQHDCEARGPFIVHGKISENIFDLGALAMFLTAWSTDMGPVGEAGPWAGKRLAILRVEDLDEEEGATSWVDVSKEMHERVRQWMWRNHEHLEMNLAI
ncbi:hypothetical protein PENSPDRAFT_655512 [Peniophora sp. CONT]|nr:hypothetical protein PENSPDRAFT_655512 [Peniophora sp. CONT]